MPDQVEIDRYRWWDGTQLMAVLLHRLSGGRPVRITREDVEAVNGGTTHPVVFTVQDDGRVMELHIRLPGELFATDDNTVKN